MATVPPEDQMRVASKIKENYSYVCQDIVKEFRKYDSDPYNMFQRYTGEHSVTGKVCVLEAESYFRSFLTTFYSLTALMSDMNVFLHPRFSSIPKSTPPTS